MQVYGPSQLHGAQGINAPHFNRVAPATTPATPSHVDTADELHLSPAADLAAKLADLPDIRWERVNAIRTAIAEGTYMNDENLGVAVDRLLDEIA